MAFLTEYGLGMNVFCFVLFCFRKLTSLSFKEGVFEILPHDSFLRHIFLKCYTFLTQKRSKLCMSLAALGDSRSLLRDLSDALMPWDASLVQPLFTLLSWSLALLGAMTGPDLCHPVSISTPCAGHGPLPSASCPPPFPLLLSSTTFPLFPFFRFGTWRVWLCNQNQCLQVSSTVAFLWLRFPLEPLLSSPASLQDLPCHLYSRCHWCLPGYFLFIFLLRGSLDY